MRRSVFLVLMIAAFQQLSAQRLSPSSAVSLLTAAPGQELYSAFGHSAVRVQDPAIGLDVVYNYGTFDFDTPNFYLKFMQGKLDYMVGKETWRNFDYVYSSYYQRTFEEQILNLTLKQRQAVYDYLVWNYQPENRFYLYDFFFDNCATRIRDVLEQQLGDSLRWGTPTKTDASFRDYLHEYLAEKSWIRVGIDLVIGAVTDREADVREQMFLPDYLASAFDGAEILGETGWQPLVSSRDMKYEGPDLVQPTPWFVAPLTVSVLLLLVFGWYSFRRYRGQTARVWPDVLLWMLLGFIGLVAFLLWFATDHTAPAQNWNLLWANPLHLVAGIFLARNSQAGWLRWYFLVAGVLGGLLLVAGPLLPQALAPAFYPLFAIVALRGWRLWKELNK